MPKPKHHYELSEDVIMQKEEDIQRQEDEILQREHEGQRDEDMEDMEKRLAEERARYEEIERKKQSQVIKLGLPRPMIVNPKYIKNALADILEYDEKAEAERLILEEVQMMMA